MVKLNLTSYDSLPVQKEQRAIRLHGQQESSSRNPVGERGRKDGGLRWWEVLTIEVFGYKDVPT